MIIKIAGSKRPAVIASVASIPHRAKTLHLSISSIIDHVDYLFVVLNGYDSIPPFLRDKKIKVLMSQDIGDHNDNAKFFCVPTGENCIYMTIDDDILYPRDYVPSMISALNRYGGKSVVGVHGSIYPEHGKNFFDRYVFPFWNKLNLDFPCSFVGTGTLAFNCKHVNIKFSNFLDTGMSDLFFAKFLKENSIPSVAVQRRPGWLKEVPTTGHPTLWHGAKRNSSRQDKLVADGAPWGVVDLLSRCASEIFNALPDEAQKILLKAKDIQEWSGVTSLLDRHVTGRSSNCSPPSPAGHASGGGVSGVSGVKRKL